MSNSIEFVINGVDKFSGTFGKLGKSLRVAAKATAAAAAATTAAAGAVVLFTQREAKLQDQVGKVAQKLGFAVDELSAYHFISEQAAISTQTFDMAVQRMARRASEAAQGTGEAVNALRELNIDARQFNRMGLDDKMKTVAESMKGVENQSDKVRLAFKLFDSEGVTMLQMLDGGSEKLDKLRKDAEFLGATMSAQGTANATAFTDAMGRLTTATGGTSRAIADKLMPIMTGFANAAADVMARSRDAVAKFAEDAINGLLFMWAAGEQVFTGIGNLIPDAFDKKWFDSFLTGFTSMLTNMFNFALRIFPAIGDYIAAVFKGIGDSIIAIGDWAYTNFINMWKGGEIKTIGDLMFDSIPAATEEAGAVMAAAFEDITTTAGAAAAGAGEAITNGLGLSMDSISERVDQIKLQFEEFGTVVDETTADMAEKITTFGDVLAEKWNTQMEQQGSVIEQLAEGSLAIINQTTEALSKGVSDAIVFGESLAKSMQGILKSVAASIIQMLIKVGIQQVVTSGIVQAAQMKDALMGIAGGAAKAASNAYAAIAAIPYVGPFLAPAIAVAAGAAVFSLGRGLLGQAHDGLSDVPNTGTYLLEQGERVVKRDQNADLTNFLSSGGSSGGSSISVNEMNLHILENATNAESLLTMSDVDWRNIVADKIINAFDTLSNQGIKPEFARVSR